MGYSVSRQFTDNKPLNTKRQRPWYKCFHSVLSSRKKNQQHRAISLFSQKPRLLN